eukprot:gene12475-biopygen12895
MDRRGTPRPPRRGSPPASGPGKERRSDTCAERNLPHALRARPEKWGMLSDADSRRPPREPAEAPDKASVFWLGGCPFMRNPPRLLSAKLQGMAGSPCMEPCRVMMHPERSTRRNVAKTAMVVGTVRPGASRDAPGVPSRAAVRKHLPGAGVVWIKPWAGDGHGPDPASVKCKTCLNRLLSAADSTCAFASLESGDVECGIEVGNDMMQCKSIDEGMGRGYNVQADAKASHKDATAKQRTRNGFMAKSKPKAFRQV